jgi:hypothetical protein
MHAANDDAVFTDENFKGEIIEGEVIRKVVSLECNSRSERSPPRPQAGED